MVGTSGRAEVKKRRSRTWRREGCALLLPQILVLRGQLLQLCMAGLGGKWEKEAVSWGP